MVTHVDKRFEDLLTSMYNRVYRELEEKGRLGQPLSEEQIQDLRNQEMNILRRMKREVEGNFRRMRGDQGGGRTTRIVYTTLKTTSWLFQGRRTQGRPQEPKPVGMKLDVADVVDFFDVKSPDDIRALLDEAVLSVGS